MNKEKPKKEADKYARDNLVETDKFIAKCKKEIKFCTIKPVKTSKKDEMENQVLFRGKKICQICRSKIAFFAQYRFEKSGRSIFKPVDQSGLDEAYDWLVQKVQSIQDIIDEKALAKFEKAEKVAKKPKKTKPGETVEDLEKRIENMSSKSNAIRVSEITDEILSWVESTDYKLVDDGHTLLVRTA